MCIYVYQAADTMTSIAVMNDYSLSHTLLHSHYSNTINISTVVMLGFWLWQFYTGSLAGGLCLLLSSKFYFLFPLV
jgi:hypothetical protein